jgi:membrane protein DedA with SNARE-associated domain
MGDALAALSAWVTDGVESGGYVAVGVLAIAEVVLLPLPSELMLMAAGWLVARGQLAFGWVVVVATLGSLLGALLLYGLGARLGEERLRVLVRAHGRWLLLDEADVDRAKALFETHGARAVFFGRCVPMVRVLISVPAGVSGMPLGRFALYTTLGSAVWNGALVAAGWALGEQRERLRPYMDALEWVTLAALLIAIAWLVRRRRARRPATASRRG